MEKELKTIQSVQRAIDIINCIADAGKKISLKEIGEELDLNVNTARGLVQTLLSNGFLARDLEQGTYSLGYEFYTKSTQLYEFQLKNIREAAYPDMQRLIYIPWKPPHHLPAHMLTFPTPQPIFHYMLPLPESFCWLTHLKLNSRSCLTSAVWNHSRKIP